MLLSKLAAVASMSLLLSFGAGCAVPSSDEASASEAALVSADAEGTFKLYEEATGQPDPQCDVHTVLGIAHHRTDGGLRAQLREVVAGTCRLYIDADLREYPLRVAGDSCGSKIYKGTTKMNGVKREITITDHRTRTCRDVVDAQVIVEENRADGIVRTLLAQ
jgi:hypothetical protein